MKMAMPKINMRVVRRWSWVGYPVGVAIVLGLGTYAIFAGQVRLWDKLQDQVRQVEEKRQLLVTINTKVTQLQSENVTTLTSDVKWLLGVVPVSEQVWVVVNQLRAAGGASGTVLVEWSGKGEGAVTGVYEVGSLDGLQPLVVQLENRLPLVKIEQVDFLNNRAEIVVSGANAPLSKGTSDQTSPVAQVGEKLTKLKQQLAGFVSDNSSLGSVEAALDTSGNPF